MWWYALSTRADVISEPSQKMSQAALSKNGGVAWLPGHFAILAKHLYLIGKESVGDWANQFRVFVALGAKSSPATGTVN